VTATERAPTPVRAGAGGRPRRALVLAGGGLKVAYQAGVLQVLLDEAGVEFDLADGASGGVFNLAMWCQGMSGRRIADNWRAYRPLRALSPNPRGTSLLTFNGMRRRVLPGFGLDWAAIRGTAREATFELYDLSRQELRAVPAAEMTEDLLLSAVALPLWFPPVRVGGDTYIDAVFATDANLGEMIRRGASELWVIWTVSTRGRWRPSLAGQYFAMVEAAANSRLRAELAAIEENNAAIAAGRPGGYGRTVTVRLISAEVPLHYLLNYRRASMARAVDLGVQDARAWCRRHGIAVAREPAAAAPAGPAVRFHEVMAGSVRTPTGSARLRLELDVVIRGVDRFVADPDHAADVYGVVGCAALGGQLTIRRGRAWLLADAPDTGGAEKRMTYELDVVDATGRTLRVRGVKRVRHDARLDVWADTTRLGTEVRDAASGAVLAGGVLRISAAGFARQLTTFRGGGVGRFWRFFVEGLWQVYGHRPAPPGPAPGWLRRAADPADQPVRRSPW
jgi:predicted acylesterase/phospholipase RssA